MGGMQIRTDLGRIINVLGSGANLRTDALVNGDCTVMATQAGQRSPVRPRRNRCIECAALGRSRIVHGERGFRSGVRPQRSHLVRVGMVCLVARRTGAFPGVPGGLREIVGGPHNARIRHDWQGSNHSEEQ